MSSVLNKMKMGTNFPLCLKYYSWTIFHRILSFIKLQHCLGFLQSSSSGADKWHFSMTFQTNARTPIMSKPHIWHSWNHASEKKYRRFPSYDTFQFHALIHFRWTHSRFIVWLLSRFFRQQRGARLAVSNEFDLLPYIDQLLQRYISAIIENIKQPIITT